jgi:hypothetical protein
MMRTSLHQVQAKARRRTSLGIQLIYTMAETQSNSSWSPSQILGAVTGKINAQGAHGLRFRRSKYAWKDNLIS